MKRLTTILTDSPLVLLIIFAALFGSCDRKPTFRIAVSQCSGGDWRDKLNDEIRREAIFEDDYNIVIDIETADDDVDRQLYQLRGLAATRPDVIAVAPAEVETLEPVIDSITQTGIPVVVFDRNVLWGRHRSFVGGDNTAIGATAAQLAAELTKEPVKALQLTGALNTTPAQERKQGFDREASLISDFDLLETVDAGWREDRAQFLTDSLLAIHPDANIIYAHNDPMAIGAANAVGARGLKDKVKIVGTDGSPYLGATAVRDSVIGATVIYPTMGHEILQTSLAIARGDTVPKIIKPDIVATVTPQNVEMYLNQYEALIKETGKIVTAKNTFDALYHQHQTQQMLFVAVCIIAVLLVAGLILFFRHNRQRQVMSDKLKEQNEELKHLNVQLKEATDSKVNFFTNVSHDLRTPLTIISSSLNRMANDNVKSDDKRVYLSLADKNAKVLTRLINQILDFDKYESRTLPFHPQETDINELLRGDVEAFLPLADNRRVDLNYSSDIEPGTTMAVDPEKIERIFYNLLSNAFKFTPPGGHIYVAASIDAKANNLKVRVTDTGSGMDASVIEKIFERHFTTQKSNNPYGSGIGLSIVKAFVEIHGGSITVTSAEDEGTSISFTIPVRHIEDSCTAHRSDAEGILTESAHIQAAAKSPDIDSPTLLVIDDNEDVRELIIQLFGDRYEVLSASSGREGIAVAEKFVPDVIICDVMMPDMDGYESCKHLKESVVTSHIPVLMLTACALDNQRREGYEHGADQYVSKPFDPDMLLTMVASLLDNRKRVYRSMLANGTKPITETKPEPVETSVIESKIQETPDTSVQTAASFDNNTIQVKLESEFYNKFLKIFEAEIGNPDLSVETLAERLHMSRVQLYRKIKALTDRSPAEVMKIIRLEKAREMLLKTDYTIMEIGYKVGFSSPSYFTKCYREHFGETPKSHR